METKDSLKAIDLAEPAQKIYSAIVKASSATHNQAIDQDRVKVLKLVLGFQNSLINAFKTKLNLFKMEDATKKVEVLKKKYKK